MQDGVSQEKLSKEEILCSLVAEHAKKMADAMHEADVHVVYLRDEDESALELTVGLKDVSGLYFSGDEYNLLGDASRPEAFIDTDVLARYAKNVDEIERAVGEAIKEKKSSIDEAIKIMEAKLGKAGDSKVKASEAD